LAGNAESTVEGYLRQLRKLADHRPEAITVRDANGNHLSVDLDVAVYYALAANR
jgi:hypothetical protein